MDVVWPFVSAPTSVTTLDEMRAHMKCGSVYPIVILGVFFFLPFICVHLLIPYWRSIPGIVGYWLLVCPYYYVVDPSEGGVWQKVVRSFDGQMALASPLESELS